MRKIIILFTSLCVLLQANDDLIMGDFRTALAENKINELLNIVPYHGLVIGRKATDGELSKLKVLLQNEQVKLDRKLRSWSLFWYGKPLSAILALVGSVSLLFGSYQFVRDEWEEEEEPMQLFKTGAGFLASAGVVWRGNPYRSKEVRRSIVRALVEELNYVPDHSALDFASAPQVGPPPPYADGSHKE